MRWRRVSDECFTWVFDGPTGDVLFSASHMPFTGTAASIVADVDGEIVIDPMHPTFHECSTSNNTSATGSPVCGTGPT